MILPRTRSRIAALALVASGMFSFTAGAAATPGDLDRTYGTDGYTSVDAGSDRWLFTGAYAQQNDNLLLVGGAMRGDNLGMLLARVRADGQLDSSFGDGGTRFVSNGTSSSGAEAPFASTMTSDGKIVTAGQSSFSSPLVVRRFSASGQPDASFGVQGRASFAPLGPRALIEQPAGKIVVVGAGAMRRLTASGAIDSSFGPAGDGEVAIPFNSLSRVLPSGKIVLGESTPPQASLPPRVRLAQYLTDGRVDRNFGVDGIKDVQLSPSGSDNGTFLAALGTSGDGQVLLSGKFDSGSSGHDFFAGKLSDTGAPDAAFGDQGFSKPFTIGSSLGGGDQGLLTQPGGSVVVAGIDTRYNFAGGLSSQDFLTTRRLLPTGQPDRTYGRCGRASTPIAQPSSQGVRSVLQTSGDLIAIRPTTNGSVLNRLDGGASAVQPLPDATADGAVDAAPTAVTITGTVDAHTDDALVRFELGTDTTYGGSYYSESRSDVVEANKGPQHVSFSVEALKPDSTYHYRIVTENGCGTTRSPDRTFTTPAEPPEAFDPSTIASEDAATITLSIHTHGRPSTYRVRYGTSPSTLATSTEASDAGASDDWTQKSTRLTGLSAGTKYFFEVVVTNDRGQTGATSGSFTTSAKTTAPSTTSAPPTSPTVGPTPGTLQAAPAMPLAAPSQGSVGPARPAGSLVAAPATPTKVAVAGRVVEVTLVLPAGGTAAVELVAARSGLVRVAATAVRIVGAAKLTAGKGGSFKLKVKLTKQGRRTLATKGRLDVTARTTFRPTTGGVSVTSRNFVLRARRR